MIKEALEYIVNISAPHLEFRNGSHYADRTLHRIPNELTASPLAVHTLSAVRDYIESGADECAEDEDSIGRRFVIHVADYDRVYLYRELNSDKARECLLEAELSAPMFPFGRWLGVEEFIINMQTHFVPTEVRDTLVQLISTVTTENGVSLADDGMTQRVTARSGISLVKQVSVPNPVVLAPLLRLSSRKVRSCSVFARPAMRCRRRSLRLTRMHGSVRLSQISATGSSITFRRSSARTLSFWRKQARHRAATPPFLP